MARSVIAAVAALLPMVTLADDPCRRTSEGVICTEEGFTALVRGCVTGRRDKELADLARQKAEGDLADAQRVIASLEARLQAPPAAVEPPPRSVRPLVTFTLGVVGTGLVATAAAWSSAPAQMRVGLGAVGVAVGVGGLILSW